MTLENILLWAFVGLLAGWLASATVGGGLGIVGDIVVGIVGSFLGSLIFHALHISTPFAGLPGVIFVAFCGAVVLLVVFRLIRRQRRLRAPARAPEGRRPSVSPTDFGRDRRKHRTHAPSTRRWTPSFWFSCCRTHPARSRLAPRTSTACVRVSGVFSGRVTSPLRVIFLDIDGVLNSEPFVAGRGSLDWDALVDPLAVERLNRLVRSSAAEIVISSSWRRQMDLARVVAILRNHGLDGEVIGATPHGASRPREIQRWLDAADETPASFVILDDVPDMEHLTPYFVRTTWEKGLLDAHVDAALAILTAPRGGRESAR